MDGDTQTAESYPKLPPAESEFYPASQSFIDHAGVEALVVRIGHRGRFQPKVMDHILVIVCGAEDFVHGEAIFNNGPIVHGK
jgi:hypothetical protein